MGTTTRKLNFNELVIALINDLNDREKEVVLKRYALDGHGKSTLEAIGKNYDITRERVRQIENEGLKKVRGAGESIRPDTLTELEKMVNTFIKQYGGFIGQQHLMNQLLHTDDEKEARALQFLLDKVIADKFNRIKDAEYDVIWHAEHVTKEDIKAIGSAIVKLIEANEKPVSFEELLDKCPECNAFPVIDKLPGENHAIIEAILQARKDLNTNILNQWGKDKWTTIRPKRMTDKAYLIMLQESRPLHFEECADLINQANFDKKKACAATVHNELILDEKYVLVGRGMYALKDWGFEEGTVSDIIAQVLKENGPLSKNDLAEHVLKQRFVQKTTITLALMNKDRFKRTEDGRYALVG